MRAVISVVGKDAVGIIAEVSEILRRHRVNIVDITQSVLQELFAMMMLADISQSDVELLVLAEELKTRGAALGLVIHVMHEDLFNSMHRI